VVVSNRGAPVQGLFFLDKIIVPVLGETEVNMSTKDKPPSGYTWWGFWLPDEDSNLDKQNQNLSYCLYTIGQAKEQAAKIRFFENVPRKPGFPCNYITSIR
jgi:hypothetical protein